MLAIENTLISEDLLEKEFVCNLVKCKGICCEEGDIGAPLEVSEVGILEDQIEAIKPFMNEIGLKVLAEQGFYELDDDGNPVTTTHNGKQCVFAVKEQNGIWACGIENAHKAGKTDFKKPISCHLYPVRLQEYTDYTAVNYDRWDICSPACIHGKNLGVPVYSFLKEPLIRKFGEEWFDQLHAYYQHTKS